MIKVAMLSKWHVHASGYAGQLKNNGKAEITCVWDDDAARGEAWAKELGCEFVADLDALLARDDVEAVICDTPTTAHHDVLIKAGYSTPCSIYEQRSPRSILVEISCRMHSLPLQNGGSHPEGCIPETICTLH